MKTREPFLSPKIVSTYNLPPSIISLGVLAINRDEKLFIKSFSSILSLASKKLMNAVKISARTADHERIPIVI